MFGYALNTIGIILQDIHKKTNHLKHEKTLITRFIH